MQALEQFVGTNYEPTNSIFLSFTRIHPSEQAVELVLWSIRYSSCVDCTILIATAAEFPLYDE